MAATPPRKVSELDTGACRKLNSKLPIGHVLCGAARKTGGW